MDINELSSSEMSSGSVNTQETILEEMEIIEARMDAELGDTIAEDEEDEEAEGATVEVAE